MAHGNPRAVCGRSVTLDHQVLTDRFGRDVLLEDIRRRLRCQQCGRRLERLIVRCRQEAV
jgi:transposase